MRYKEGKSTRSLTMCTKSCVIDSMASLSYFAVGLHTFNVQASYRVGRLSHLLIIAPLVNEDIHSSHVYFNSKLDIRNLQYLCPVEWSVNGVSVTPALQYFTDIYSPDCFESKKPSRFCRWGTCMTEWNKKIRAELSWTASKQEPASFSGTYQWMYDKDPSIDFSSSQSKSQESNHNMGAWRGYKPNNAQCTWSGF